MAILLIFFRYLLTIKALCCCVIFFFQKPTHITLYSITLLCTSLVSYLRSFYQKLVRGLFRFKKRWWFEMLTSTKCVMILSTTPDKLTFTMEIWFVHVGCIECVLFQSDSLSCVFHPSQMKTHLKTKYNFMVKSFSLMHLCTFPFFHVWNTDIKKKKKLQMNGGKKIGMRRKITPTNNVIIVESGASSH